MILNNETFEHRPIIEIVEILRTKHVEACGICNGRSSDATQFLIWIPLSIRGAIAEHLVELIHARMIRLVDKGEGADGWIVSVKKKSTHPVNRSNASEIETNCE